MAKDLGSVKPVGDANQVKQVVVREFQQSRTVHLLLAEVLPLAIPAQVVDPIADVIRAPPYPFEVSLVINVRLMVVPG